MEPDEEDPYGGDWGEIGGWPEPVLPPDEEEAAPWPPEPGPQPGPQPDPDRDGLPEQGSEG